MHRLESPIVDEDKRVDFFHLVKAGFSAKRKKLRSSLAGGLRLEKVVVERLLGEANIAPDARAEDLRSDQWLTLLDKYDIMKR